MAETDIIWNPQNALFSGSLFAQALNSTPSEWNSDNDEEDFKSLNKGNNVGQAEMNQTIDINVKSVQKLIDEQFPHWSHLPIKQVLPGGHDNRTFRLGQEMSARLPSAECYAPKVSIEQKWLPILANNVSVLIPTPIAMGKPTSYYPWPWSIYAWIDGESAHNLPRESINLELVAIQLANFLKELHKIDTTNAPVAGPHNFYRGGDLFVYNDETYEALEKLHNHINVPATKEVWERALSSTFHGKPVWIHGDISSGNILIKNKQLTAVIDFGGMSIGDPSCDLAIAWTFFSGKSRETFKSNIPLDQETWARAAGWALWKALITLASINDKHSVEAIKQQQIINDIFHL
jgi:aminoglycoside phosphotransferase (APT) family kinase protein